MSTQHGLAAGLHAVSKFISRPPATRWAVLASQLAIRIGGIESEVLSMPSRYHPSSDVAQRRRSESPTRWPTVGMFSLAGACCIVYLKHLTCLKMASKLSLLPLLPLLPSPSQNQWTAHQTRHGASQTCILYHTAMTSKSVLKCPQHIFKFLDFFSSFHSSYRRR
ncbi:hypothetical protein F5Y08DRAFT_301973 [Xylaria arbuscula]|nr:hypothetical protein F5Y08DRAFT_301973 [Xylaria arbuscula]